MVPKRRSSGLSSFEIAITSPARESGRQWAGLHLSFCPSKPNPPVSHPTLQQNTCCRPFCPISSGSHRSGALNISFKDERPAARRAGLRSQSCDPVIQTSFPGSGIVLSVLAVHRGNGTSICWAGQWEERKGRIHKKAYVSTVLLDTHCVHNRCIQVHLKSCLLWAREMSQC